MKTLVLLSFIFLGFSIKAKDFNLSLQVESVGGDTKSLKEIVNSFPEEKPILVYMWASWCPDCMAEAPFLKSYLEKKGKKISTLYFSVDKNRKDWLKKKKDTGHGEISVRYPTGWSDNTFRKEIKLDWIPRYILINNKGEIIHEYAIKIADEKLKEAISKAITK